MLIAYMKWKKVPVVQEVIQSWSNNVNNDNINTQKVDWIRQIIESHRNKLYTFGSNYSLSISELSNYYKEAKLEFDRNAEFQANCYQETVHLQLGLKWLEHDIGGSDVIRYTSKDLNSLINITIWKIISDKSIQNFLSIYKLLRIHSDLYIQSESSYYNQLPSLVDEFMRAGIAVTHEGTKSIIIPAKLVHTDNNNTSVSSTAKVIKGLNNEEVVPEVQEDIVYVLEKSSGGYLYNTTDLAAMKYRIQTLGATKLLYVVDIGQALHFKTLFAIARHKCNWLTTYSENNESSSLECVHVDFGIVLGADSKRIRSRAGGNAGIVSNPSGNNDIPGTVPLTTVSTKLMDLLDAAVTKAKAELVHRHKDRADSNIGQLDTVAQSLAVNAVKYADLCNHRSTNIMFSLDKMLNFNGNTAPYLLYTSARIHQLLLQLQNTHHAEWMSTAMVTPDHIKLVSKYELELMRTLIQFEDVLFSITKDHCPHKLCNYLYTVAQIYNQFYENCPVIKVNHSTPEKVHYVRVVICVWTQKVLKDGFQMLGLEFIPKL